MTDARRMRSRPGWWHAMAETVVVLPVVRLLLWTRGFRRTVGLLAARSPEPAPDARAAGPVPEAVAEVAAAVTIVSRLAPMRTRCLARSITIWWLCRRRHHHVDLVIGVAAPEAEHLPAHAWVEHGNVVLNDTPDVGSRFQPMPIPMPGDDVR